MLTLSDFLAELDQAEHLALGNHLGAGLHAARMAAACLTDLGERHQEHVAQWLAYLSTAIRELEAARAMVQRKTCAPTLPPVRGKAPPMITPDDAYAELLTAAREALATVEIMDRVLYGNWGRLRRETRERLMDALTSPARDDLRKAIAAAERAQRRA